MNNRKLNQLFTAARKETPPASPVDFADGVVRAMRNDPAPAAPTDSWSGPLNTWFPRLAWGAAVFIVLCIAGDLSLGVLNFPSVNDGVNRLPEEWLFILNGD